MSSISKMHYAKLVGRLALFIAAIMLYIVNPAQIAIPTFAEGLKMPVLMGIIWIVFAVEMMLRFFPSKFESMGCQKQFARNFMPTNVSKIKLDTKKGTLIVAVEWFILNAIIGGLYFGGIIDEGILLIISLFYSVCDMICILFFCPFQTWNMKNKCCTTCRIYNWDFAMMFTPFLFIPDFYTWSLLFIAVALLITWEVFVRRHPERFSEKTNGAIRCANCKERLCHHKKQLRHFHKTHKGILTAWKE
ncbi:MAG: hypothetical protein IKV63_03380 [Clostridia bacterium]|nr:hypothetical protein [Clostridia bacterium]